MHKIYPAGPGARPIGTGEPLGARDRIRPSASGEPDVRQIVADLADIYAYPSPVTRPWVRANMIASVDGAMTVDGRSAGLSGAADRLVFSVLRSLADVILVGAGTARIERYARVRTTEAWPALRTGRSVTPPIAVCTRRLDLDLDGPLLAAGSGLARTVVITTKAAPAERRAAAARTADVIVAGEERVTTSAAVAALAAAGYHRILTEGGPTFLGQLVAENMLDDLCLTISPVLEGGHTARIIQPPGAVAGADTAGHPQAAGGPQLGLPTGLILASVLQDDDYLLLRYLRPQRAERPTARPETRPAASAG